MLRYVCLQPFRIRPHPSPCKALEKTERQIAEVEVEVEENMHAQSWEHIVTMSMETARDKIKYLPAKYVLCVPLTAD